MINTLRKIFVCYSIVWVGICAFNYDRFWGDSVLVLGLTLATLSLPIIFSGRESIMVSAPLVILATSSFVPAMLLLSEFDWLITPPFPMLDLVFGARAVFLSSIFFVLGSLLATVFISKFSINDVRNVSRHDVVSNLEPRWLFAMCVVLMLVSAAPFWFGINQYIQSSSIGFVQNTILQAIIIIVDPDIAILITVVLFFRLTKPTKARLFYVIATLLVYLVLTVSFGSRSGLFRVIIFGVFLLVFFDLKISRLFSARSIATATAILTLSLALFHLATYKRIADSTRTELSSPALVNIYKAYLRDGAMIPVLNRMAMPALYAAGINHSRHDESARQRYFSIEYLSKSLINRLPGTIYPEANIDTSRAIPIIFRGSSHELTENSKRYFSEIYTMWGISKLISPNFYYLLMFIIGAAWTSIVVLIYHRRTKYPVAYFFCGFFLPGTVVWSMGLDHGVWLLSVTAVRLFFVLTLLSLLSGVIFGKKIEWRQVFVSQVR